MKRFQFLRVSKDALLILSLVALIVQFIAFTGVGNAVAEPINLGTSFYNQFLSVFVANDSAHPVPVAVQGAVAIQGPVAVQGPLDTSAVDSSASQAFQTTLRFYWEDNNEFEPLSADSFTVPTGKRLIIRNVSGQAQLPVGQKLLYVGLFTTVGGRQDSHYFPTNFAGTLGTEKDFYQFGQESWIVADGGTTVYVVALRSSGTNPDNLARLTSIGIAGYLIDVSS